MKRESRTQVFRQRLFFLAVLCSAVFVARDDALAQRVELLTFDGAVALVDGPAASTSHMAQTLTADFGHLGRSNAATRPPRPSTAVSPSLKTGSFPGDYAQRDEASWSRNCTAFPYRPRRDLPLTTELRRARLYPAVARAACEAGVPVGLFDALVAQESGYDVAALSSKGAMGLSQLMPGTARYLAVHNPFDALSNLRGGARYLREQLSAFGRVDLALAAYNAGPSRVRRNWSIPAIAETRNYVTRVTRGWELGVNRVASLLDLRSQPALTLDGFAAAPLVQATGMLTSRPAEIAEK